MLLREGPVPPAVEGPGAKSGVVRIVMSPGRTFALALAIARERGVLSISAEEIVIEPFSPAERALRAWQKSFAAVQPRRVKTRWQPW